MSLDRFNVYNDRYLSTLSDESEETNYEVFRAFACDSTDTLLAMLYKLGHFYAKLFHIAVEIIEMREAFGHEEEDIGGYYSLYTLKSSWKPINW